MLNFIKLHTILTTKRWLIFLPHPHISRCISEQTRSMHSNCLSITTKLAVLALYTCGLGFVSRPCKLRLSLVRQS